MNLYFRNIVLFFILITFFSCTQKVIKKDISPKIHLPPSIFYSKTGLDFQNLDYLYKDVPVHYGQNLAAFIQYINRIDYRDNGYKIDSSLSSRFQTFVDTLGNVDSIFLLKSLSHVLDSLAFKALSTSKFKKLYKDGNPTMYSFIVEYFYQSNQILWPKVNTIVVPDTLVRSIRSNTKSESIPPYIIHKEESLYPQEALQKGIEGRVILEIIIDKDGNVLEAKVIKSDNNLLNQASIDAALKCKFEPGIVDGEVVKSRMMLDYNFSINKEE